MNLNSKSIYHRLVLTGIFLFISIIPYTHSKLAMAEAWLVKEGEHKYSYGHFSANKKSKKILGENEKYLNDIYIKEYELFQDRYEILSQYRNRFGELPNSKRVLVEEIDKDLKELDELKDLFSPFSTYQENKLSVIYGVSDKHNLGVDITYSDNVRNSSKYRAKAAEFHHKHAFYQGNRFIVSLRSAISHNNYYYNKSKTTLKESLFLGISKKNKHFGDGFLEIGLHGSTGLEHANIGQHSIGFSFSQGAKILWGLELSNYSQVDYYKQDSKKSNAAKVKGEFFDQFSIAKEFNFANIMGARTLKPNNNNVTLQLGYFWKGVISQSNSIVSGPTISLWFTI